MNRATTVFLSALDAVIVVAIGLGIPLIPLTVMWAVQFGLSVDWLAFWRAAGDLWLLGNGVDLRLAIDPALALRLGVAGAETPFEVGIAPLGFALLTLLLGTRSGRRLSATPYPVTGAVVGVVVLAALGLAVAFGARDDAAMPSIAQSIVFPAAVYAAGLAIGYAWKARRSPSREPAPEAPLGRRWRAAIASVPETERSLVALALRGGALTAATVVGFSALAMAVILVANFSSIVALYESLQAGLLGGITLTLAQLALLPNLIVWTASWFVGPGFALGAGSGVSPLGTQLGLVPSLPVLGALPQGTPVLGFVGLLVPVAAGFLAAAVLRPVFLRAVAGRQLGGARGRAVRLVGVAVGIGLVGASILALLALWSGGAAGPGRLAEVGPDAGAVWLWAFVELTVSSALGLVAGATSSGAGAAAGAGAGASPRSASASGAGAASTLHTAPIDRTAPLDRPAPSRREAPAAPDTL